MKQGFYEITENIKLAHNTFEMRLCGDTSAFTNPGQFLNIKLDGLFLRRPISVCSYSENEIVIIYKTVGEGTEKMSKMLSGEKLDILTGLGNGFDTSISTDSPLVIGGGAGVAPLYGLCECLVREGKKPKVILEFNSKAEVYYEDKFAALTPDTYVTTVDGTHGTKGFVTDVMKNLDYGYFYTCGPMPMFKAVEKIAKTSGQFSFEERMGCGFGACMGCSCKILTGGYKRICKEGPVMEREEILWTQA